VLLCRWELVIFKGASSSQPYSYFFNGWETLRRSSCVGWTCLSIWTFSCSRRRILALPHASRQCVPLTLAWTTVANHMFHRCVHVFHRHRNSAGGVSDLMRERMSSQCNLDRNSLLRLQLSHNARQRDRCSDWGHKTFASRHRIGNAPNGCAVEICAYYGSSECCMTCHSTDRGTPHVSTYRVVALVLGCPLGLKSDPHRTYVACVNSS